MKRDKLGRPQSDRGTDIWAACRCCHRRFIPRGGKVTDRTTQCRYGKEGYCDGCLKNANRNGTPTCRHDFQGGVYCDPFTTEQNILHTIRFLARIRRPGRNRKDPHMGIRTDLLNSFMATHADTVIGDEPFGVSSVDLGVEYLRYLTGNTDLEVPGDAIHWAPLTEDPAQAIPVLYRIADWTSAYRGKHSIPETPQYGDLVIFAGPGSHYYGTLGVYLSHNQAGYRVFTQGHQEIHMPAREFLIRPRHQSPVGWWRVREHLLLERTTQEARSA